MRYVYEKETLKLTRERLKGFLEIVQLMDKKTLDEIAQNMFDAKNAHFDDLMTMKSGFQIVEVPNQRQIGLSEIEKYMHKREYRIAYIHQVISAIYELYDEDDPSLFNVILYRYVYGFTITAIADMMEEDPRVIRRWSRKAELMLASSLETIVYS